ncbi:hypothetical protein JOC94_004724 [Bacillus thermophilus]|uniref:Uncharacterized protein n=1 Tax=Siminovitchia thermophila TaxID=1245522 RepID=A0ABS2RDG3_9BACI|nr:hypothetical protein [Siminovitchia thermophila]
MFMQKSRCYSSYKGNAASYFISFGNLFFSFLYVSKIFSGISHMQGYCILQDKS